MVISECHDHDGAYDNFAIHDDRFLLDRVHSENSSLRKIDAFETTVSSLECR